MSGNVKSLEVIIHGDIGKIQGQYCVNPDKSAPVALILPPEPHQGGTMDNHIIASLFNVFVSTGCTVLKINFRGVGKTDGTFDDGNGELVDASIVLDWLQTNNPDASHFWVIGYSFGSWVAANLMMRRPEIEGCILISPLVNKYDYTFLSPLPCSTLIIHGEKDSVVKNNEVIKYIESLNAQNSNTMEFTVIPNGTHFFQNQTEEVAQAALQYVNTRLATRVRKPVRKKRRRRKKRDSDI